VTRLGVLTAAGVFVCSLLSFEQSFAKGKNESDQTSGVGCPAASSESAKNSAVKLAEKVRFSIKKPDRLHQFETFELHVKLPNDRTLKGEIGIIIAVSKNARFEEVDPDVAFYSPGEKIEVNEPLSDMHRAYIWFTTRKSDNPNKIRVAIRAWSVDPIYLSWAIMGGWVFDTNCAPQQITSISRAGHSGG
jgi:hypothetical protein